MRSSREVSVAADSRCQSALDAATRGGVLTMMCGTASLPYTTAKTQLAFFLDLRATPRVTRRGVVTRGQPSAGLGTA